jgi:phosphatidylserine decarboxylase
MGKSDVIVPRVQPRSILFEALPVLLVTLGAAAVLGILGYRWLSGAAGIVALFVLWFFRNPERIIPQDQNGVVSPADGRVVEVSKVHEDHLLHREAIKIGIFMSPLDVHVNRIPFGGKILAVLHQSGKFHSAFKAVASLENEQNAVLLETPTGKKILFVQIAGMLARRIVCWIREGERVQKGQRFGMIKFGSRLDLYLPPDTQVFVRLGEKVKGGATLIGILQ